MPFDCTPILDVPKQLAPLSSDAVEIGSITRTVKPIRVRPIPHWYVSRQPEAIGAAVAVLVRARDLIADNQHWCKRSSARGWLDIPVPVQSAFARRFCAIGAIQRAARELGLPFDEASAALEWQTVRPIPAWNDDPQRTHAEVVAAFDAAIIALA
jgi:hypothetical protein